MNYIFRMTSIIITTIISLLLSTITLTDNTLLEESHYFKSAEEIIDSLSTNVQIKNAKYFKAGWA